ncbi:MAG: CrcB family protein [Bacteroidia bacterium]|nr:CrcB family protein [Bacteroidia bacterium]MDW8235412.1 CrcB family protein [Bacteroidia bacterium]
MRLIGAVAVGAIIGALLRFGLQRIGNTSSLYPVGTLFVNVGGSFVLGLVVGWVGVQPYPWFQGITAGFCGSLTTFSSISLETFFMLREGLYWRAGAYILLTLGLGLIGLALGYGLGTKLQKIYL